MSRYLSRLARRSRILSAATPGMQSSKMSATGGASEVHQRSVAKNITKEQSAKHVMTSPIASASAASVQTHTDRVSSTVEQATAGHVPAPPMSPPISVKTEGEKPGRTPVFSTKPDQRSVNLAENKSPRPNPESTESPKQHSSELSAEQRNRLVSDGQGIVRTKLNAGNTFSTHTTQDPVSKEKIIAVEQPLNGNDLPYPVSKEKIIEVEQRLNGNDLPLPVKSMLEEESTHVTTAPVPTDGTAIENTAADATTSIGMRIYEKQRIAAGVNIDSPFTADATFPEMLPDRKSHQNIEINIGSLSMEVHEKQAVVATPPPLPEVKPEHSGHSSGEPVSDFHPSRYYLRGA